MCGIAGWYAPEARTRPADRNTLESMVEAIAHRGPDEFGLYLDPRVGLGHARLAIIDVVSGQQPMGDDRGASWLVFNGEIFNYVELREELIAAGHRFRTGSDTEVILQAWEAWGDRAFERFNGQFALALWDSANEALVLARDRLGVRPLYLCEHEGRLWFGSEVKAIFAADPSIPRALDPTGLAETFTFWSTVAPQSVFQGVTELEPGHLRILSPAGTIDRAYWTPRYPEGGAATFEGSLEDASREVRATLTDAVRLRMVRADVPVGSYLSGGLDSSLVAALGREAVGSAFATFSIRFEDAEFDETPFQRAMAERLGTDHHELMVRTSDIAAVFPRVVAHAERPLLRTAPAPLFLLSAAVHEAGFKVVLTGEGADEMFGGYDLFREGRVRRFWARQPDSAVRPRLLDRLYPYLARSPVASQAMAREFFGRDLAAADRPGFAHQTRWRPAAAIQRLFTPDLRAQVGALDVVDRLLCSLPVPFSRWSTLAQDQYLEIRTLMSGYLLSSQGDRMLMAHSVEGRFPYLDTRVVELANSLPPSYKLFGLDEKHVLKRVAAGLVPDEIIGRTKQPYRAPDAVSFLGDDAPDWVAHVLDPDSIRDAGVFDPVGVDRLWRKCRADARGAGLSNGDNMALVGVLSTGLLHEQFVRDDRPSTQPVHFLTVVDRLRDERRDGVTARIRQSQ
ncbi:MAG TPA: asparagine synthase (glutamine-hydrolyzing) [Candidatus Limnocylindrales bacterium]|nr:asparagine synthase (glutamine-hydrolyzing) [Candidatus Limnocylindrales bacterium]